jgi:hypothetical protein
MPESIDFRRETAQLCDIPDPPPGLGAANRQQTAALESVLLFEEFRKHVTWSALSPGNFLVKPHLLHLYSLTIDCKCDLPLLRRAVGVHEDDRFDRSRDHKPR